MGAARFLARARSGTERVVYRFKGGKDGAYPVARLIVDNAMLYGTTQYGGPQTPFCATGCGTLFQMSRRRSEEDPTRIFLRAQIARTAPIPAAGVTEFDGKLYGTTMGGGRDGDGAVFEAGASSGTERVLHSFSCCGTSTDGSFPFARLVRIGNLLFGTTRDGGTSNAGTIFSIRPSGSEAVVHDFGGKPDGALPEAGPHRRRKSAFRYDFVRGSALARHGLRAEGVEANYSVLRLLRSGRAALRRARRLRRSAP